jgi:hypothetical protein
MIFDLERQVSTALNLEGRQVETVTWHPQAPHLGRLLPVPFRSGSRSRDAADADRAAQALPVVDARWPAGLFFPAPPGVLQSASVSLGDRAQVGAARTLFPIGELEALSVSADGTRFLAIKQRPVPRPRQIVIVQNWPRELTRIVPVR